MMKKIISVWLAVILLLAAAMPVAAAESFAVLTGSTAARVEEVIDGDAMRIRLSDGRAALVKLIGVDTMGSTAAHEYLVSQALGADLIVVPDANVPGDGRWTVVYAYRGNETLNGRILQNGLGKLNESHVKASQYQLLSAKQDAARAAQIGIWAESSQAGITVVGRTQVNINTATSAQLQRYLVGVTSTLAAAMIAYRDKNPFTTVDEVKFVKGFTKELYDKNRSSMAVATNVKLATYDELLCLKSFTDADVQKIAAHRMRYGLGALRDLVQFELISEEKYNANLPYMALEFTSRISHAIPASVANINTASYTQLMSAGLTSTQANKLIAFRAYYSFKSLSELSSVSSLGLTDATLNTLSDTLRVTTDVNRATKVELQSLFGSPSSGVKLAETLLDNRPFLRLTDVQILLNYATYERIAPFIYIDTFTASYVNANTATVAQLVAAGIPQAEAEKLHAEAGKMTSPDRIPSAQRVWETYFTLYTNINTASPRELASLSVGMTAALVDAIVAYRADQSFGSAEEIALFFKSHNKTAVYEECKAFIGTK